jgi:adenylate cyclase class 2
MIENEIKISLSKEDLVELVKTLKELKAEKEFCVQQITNRFDTANQSLESRGVFLRTRTGEINTLTLKRKISGGDNNIKSREEIEIDLNSKEEVYTLNKIINILGFEKLLIMEKYRMQWSFNDCKIAIDELPFGFYVEIEGEKDNLFKVSDILKLNRSDSLTSTYWDIFRGYKEKNGIVNQEDIKFLPDYKSFLMEINND